jgi:hypothetical protein
VSIMSYQLEQALEARREEDILRMPGDKFMVLYWTAPEVTFTRFGRIEAAQVVIDKFITQFSHLEFRLGAGWPNVAGSPDAFYPLGEIERECLPISGKVLHRCISCGSGVGYLRNPKRPLSCCLIKMNEKPVTDPIERFTALATRQVER